MPAPPGSSPDLSVARYGRGHHDRHGGTTRPRWVWPAFVVVALLLGVGWAWWSSQAQANRPVDAQVFGYEVLSDDPTRLELRLDRADGAAATCEVYAMAADHPVVGDRTVQVPAGAAGATGVTAEITTERRAVTGLLRGCDASS